MTRFTLRLVRDRLSKQADWLIRGTGIDGDVLTASLRFTVEELRTFTRRRLALMYYQTLKPQWRKRGAGPDALFLLSLWAGS